MSATASFAGMADTAALAPFIAPYRRVAGTHGSYREVALPGPAPKADSAMAASARATARTTGGELPSAKTTTSFSEMKTMSTRHVPPRYGPTERFSEPLTAAMEVGWRTAELGGRGYFK